MLGWPRRLPSETKAKLERLAGRTHRTRGELAEEALTAYLDRELAIVEAVEQGRTEIRAGRGLDTESVFREVEAVTAEIEADRARR